MVELEELPNGEGWPNPMTVYAVYMPEETEQEGALFVTEETMQYLHYGLDIPEYITLDCSLDAAKQAIYLAILLHRG